MEAQPCYLHPIQPDINETSSFKHEVLNAEKLGEVGCPPRILSSTPEKSDSSMTGTCQVIIEANLYIFDQEHAVVIPSKPIVSIIKHPPNPFGTTHLVSMSTLRQEDR
jgi:hypothetical protein